MRGLAAVAVVLRHFGQQFQEWEPALSYLSVDLFFALSGFVLSANYDQKLSSVMSPWSFLRLRGIRLFPLSALGAAFGLIAAMAISSDFTANRYIGAILSGFAIPWPLTGSRLLFPTNTAFWTLFFELWIANLSFAFLWRFLKNWILYALIACSGLALVICERHFHYLDIGWQWDQFGGGLARLLFSFYAGVAIHRIHLKWPSPIRVPAPVILVILTAVLFAPLPGRLLQAGSLIAALGILPILLYFSAAAEDPHIKFSAFLGDVSYALYTIHIPLIILFAWVLRECGVTHLGGLSFFIVEVAFVPSVIILAALIDIIYDRPVRRWLAGHLPLRVKP